MKYAQFSLNNLLKLVDVFEHDDTCLHGDAEKREKANAGRDTEIGSGDK